MFLNVVKLIRVQHWIKNLFIFVPLIFALKFTELDLIIKSIIAFFSFSLASSFVYIVNDIVDKEKDQTHPKKKFRPIANERITIPNAIILSVFVIILALGLGILLNVPTFSVVLAYLIMNIFYSFILKNVVLIDVFTIAMGFVLRVVAGAVAINVEISNWVLLTTFFISLFLGFGKRRCELDLANDGKDYRPVLDHYSIQLLDYMIVVSLTLTIIAYSLYVVDPEIILKFKTDKLMYTIPIVVYGVFRYLHSIYVKKEGEPSEIVFSDPGLIISVLLWGASVLTIFLVFAN